MYAEIDEIFGIVKFLRPDFTIDEIDEHLQAMAVTDILAELEEYKIYDPDDINGLLRSAEICFYIELAGMVRETESAFGIVGQETMGSYTKKYSVGMPMFFFAQGSNKPFLQLLPNETWRMRGFKYVTRFKNAYWNRNDENGGLRPTPNVQNDMEFHWI